MGIILDFSQLLVAENPVKFLLSRGVLFTPLDSTFGTHSTKIFFNFLLNQKSFYKPKLKYFLDIIKNIFIFLGPPTTKKKWKFHIWSVGYQSRVKRVIGVHFWRNFWKIFKNEDFGNDIFEIGQILRPFSCLAPSKLK